MTIEVACQHNYQQIAIHSTYTVKRFFGFPVYKVEDAKGYHYFCNKCADYIYVALKKNHD